jgi:perosamine synthetase
MPEISERVIAISQPALGEDEWYALKGPVLSGWVTQGPKVAEFEQRFAAYHGVSHAIAVTSCTTGLHLALKAMGVGHGDEVIVPSFTWLASVNAVLYCGATPVLIDVDSKTYNIDIKQLAEKITSKTKVVIPVHLFGLCVDVDKMKIVVPDNVYVLEDAACAAGASLNGQYAGALGDVAVFSFHPRKTITTGEGGMITTNDSKLAKTITMMRNHGASVSEEERHNGAQPYILPDFDLLGYNYRMTDLQGAMGLVQLGKLNGLICERRQWASYYNEQLAGVEWLQTPTVSDGCKHGWQAYVCLVDESKSPASRNIIMKYLQERGISTRPGTHAVHLLTLYRNRFGYAADDFPAANACAKYSMALPLHNRMSADDFAYVVQEIKRLGC